MKYLTPHETTRIYLSLKLHFSRDKYDSKKYNFVTNLSQASFDKRKDKYHFAKVAKRFQTKERIVEYFISNFVDDPGKWIGNFDEECHRRRIGRIEGLSHRFRSNLATIAPAHKEGSTKSKLFRSLKDTDDGFPQIFELYQQGKVDVETLCILDYQTRFIDGITIPVELWSDKRMVIKKYTTLIGFNTKEFADITKSFISK